MLVVTYTRVERMPGTLSSGESLDDLGNLLLEGEEAIGRYLRWNGQTLEQRLQRETRILGDPAHPIADAQRLVAQVNTKLAKVATSNQALEKTQLEIQLTRTELKDLEEEKAKLEHRVAQLEGLDQENAVLQEFITEARDEVKSLGNQIEQTGKKIGDLEDRTKIHSQEISQLTSTTLKAKSTESVEEALAAAQEAFRKDYATEITWNDVRTVIIENAWLADVGDRICEVVRRELKKKLPSCGGLGEVERFWRQRIGHAFRKYREQRNRTIDVIASTRVKSGIVTVPEAQGISPALMLDLIPDGSTDLLSKATDKIIGGDLFKKGDTIKDGRRRVSVPGLDKGVWVPYLHETRVKLQMGIASNIEWDSGTQEAESLLAGLGIKVNKAVSLNFGWAESLENGDQDGIYYGVSVSLNNLLGIFGNND